jgi:hypothetical protein
MKPNFMTANTHECGYVYNTPGWLRDNIRPLLDTVLDWLLAAILNMYFDFYGFTQGLEANTQTVT